VAKPSQGPFTATAQGVRVALRVQPGARGDGIDGLATLADGRLALKARVAAAPEAGKANAALVKLLAKAWRLPKGAISVVAGQGARTKTLEVAGEPVSLLAQLERWLAETIEAS